MQDKLDEFRLLCMFKNWGCEVDYLKGEILIKHGKMRVIINLEIIYMFNVDYAIKIVNREFCKLVTEKLSLNGVRITSVVFDEYHEY